MRILRSLTFLAVSGFTLLPRITPGQTASSGIIITVAGSGLAGPPGDGGPARDARLTGPVALAVGRDGTLYFHDLHDGLTSGDFRSVNPTNGIINTIVTGVSVNPEIGLDRSRHKLYFPDFDDNVVLQINLSNNAVTAFAGVGWSYPFPLDGSGNRGDGGPASQAWFSGDPSAVCVDGAGNVFIAETSRIRKVDAISGIISTVFGRAQSCCGMTIDIDTASGDGGPATNATGSITRMAVDGAGDIFIMENVWDPNTEQQVSHIRRIDAASGLIDTIAGAGTKAPDSTGPAVSIGLTNLQAIAVNNAGSELFLGGLSRIYRIDLITGILAPYAGNGTNGFSGDGGPALNAEFNENGVHCLAVAPGGGLLISDYGNLRIRYVAPNSITLTNDFGQTEFHLPWVSSLEGDLILTNNPNLALVDANSLTNVGGSLVINAGGTNTTGGDLNLSSLTTVNGSVVINADSTNNTGGNLNLSSLTTVNGSVVIDAGGTNNTGGDLNLSSLTTVNGSVVINAGGTNSTGGDLNLSSLTTVNGSVVINAGGTNTTGGDLDLSSLTSVSGSLVIDGVGTNIDLSSLTNVCGDITIVSNAPDATVDLNSLTTVGGCGTNTVIVMADGNVSATKGITIDTNATLAGSATVDGSVTNNGTISPGASPGHLGLQRNLVLKPSSRLQIEIGGYATNQFDSIRVGQAVVLDGKLSVSLIGNFPEVMTNGGAFTILSAGAPLTGAFANVPSGGELTTTDGRARFTVRYSGQNSVTLSDLVVFDRDGDGAPDADELAAGTDPHNPASVFRVLSARQEGADMRITWSAVGGKSYVLQTNSGNLGSGFSDFGGVIAVPGSGEFTTNVLDSGALTNSPPRYYRVRVAP